MEIGLTVNDYCFANYLKGEKDFSPHGIAGRIDELRTEYNQM